MKKEKVKNRENERVKKIRWMIEINWKIHKLLEICKHEKLRKRTNERNSDLTWDLKNNNDNN